MTLACRASEAPLSRPLVIVAAAALFHGAAAAGAAPALLGADGWSRDRWPLFYEIVNLFFHILSLKHCKSGYALIHFYICWKLLQQEY